LNRESAIQEGADVSPGREPKREKRSGGQCRGKSSTLQEKGRGPWTKTKRAISGRKKRGHSKDPDLISQFQEMFRKIERLGQLGGNVDSQQGGKQQTPIYVKIGSVVVLAKWLKKAPALPVRYRSNKCPLFKTPDSTKEYPTSRPVGTRLTGGDRILKKKNRQPCYGFGLGKRLRSHNGQETLGARERRFCTKFSKKTKKKRQREGEGKRDFWPRGNLVQTQQGGGNAKGVHPEGRKEDPNKRLLSQDGKKKAQSATSR